MRMLLCLFIAMFGAVAVAVGVTRTNDPVLDYTTVSVHTVRYGTMPFHTKGRGAIVHFGPDSRARVQVLVSFAQHLKLGDAATVKVVGLAGQLAAEVTKIGDAGTDGTAPVELTFAKRLPSEVTVGDSADALIEYGKIENTLYMERGGFDAENVEVPVFRVDPDQHATRVTVRFGVIASELIEIKSGLHEGDKVIVTDMSPFAAYERIAIKQ